MNRMDGMTRSRDWYLVDGSMKEVGMRRVKMSGLRSKRGKRVLK